MTDPQRDDAKANRVHIEFQRVQTWLFSAPRLRAMVGANAMLGRVLRVDLPDLAKRGTDSLSDRKWMLQPLQDSERFPGSDKDDPLGQEDDPRADALAGILSRDGGHFEADFSTGAEQFAVAAADLLRRELPGLRFRVSVDGTALPAARTDLPVELPTLAPCGWTGRGLASAWIQQGKDSHRVSLDIKLRHDRAQKLVSEQAKGQDLDLAQQLLRRSPLGKLVVPEDLEDLVGNGYLALIHADGNGVGRGGGDGDATRSAFFHRNRLLLRRALECALANAECEPSKQDSSKLGVQPLIPLMLGGDDLLVVCRAEIALPFVVELCGALAEFQEGGEPDASFQLTLGIGVVIARRSIPIHRLHEAAEQLASSAKRRVRGLKDARQTPRSVVDWAVYSSSWIDAPEDLRQRDWIRGRPGALRVLSQRPMDVCGQGLGTLQGLVQAAQPLGGARSQLRYLVDQLPLGKTLAELAFLELAPETRAALGKAGLGALWQSVEGGEVTALLDLVEVAEIARLGRARSKERKVEGVREETGR